MQVRFQVTHTSEIRHLWMYYDNREVEKKENKDIFLPDKRGAQENSENEV